MKIMSGARSSNWSMSLPIMLLQDRCIVPNDIALSDHRFATDRAAVVEATNALRYSAGLFCTFYWR